MNVAHIRNHPAINPAATSTGTDVVLAQIYVDNIRTVPQMSSQTLFENLNFKRNITAKLMAMPTSWA